MDFVEKATETFLQGLNIGSVQFEPCGKSKFPDFSIDNRIGVECTRLTEVHVSGGTSFNIGEVSHRLHKAIERDLDKIDHAIDGKCFFLMLDYSVEIDIRVARRTIQAALKEFVSNKAFMPLQIVKEDNLEVSLIEASRTHEKPFILGGSFCRESGGWRLDQLAKQTIGALQRKSRNVEKSNQLFEEWWLAVAGYLSLGVSDAYVDFLQKELPKFPNWSQVVLVDLASPQTSRIIKLRPGSE